MQTDIYVFFIATGASITPEKLIPINKSRIKSIATSPPRKDPIPNQNKNTLGIKKYQSLPPHVPKFSPGFKSLRNEADGDNHEYTDTSRTDKDDMSLTNQDNSIENLKSMKNKNDNEEYKEENLQHQNGNGRVINKTKEEEAFIKRLMSMNFQQKFIQYVIGTVT